MKRIGKRGGLTALQPRTYSVHILADDHDATLHVGVASDLARGLRERAEQRASGAARARLVHVETYQDERVARAREQRLKQWRREALEALIRTHNPQLRDLRAGSEAAG